MPTGANDSPLPEPKSFHDNMHKALFEYLIDLERDVESCSKKDTKYPNNAGINWKPSNEIKGNLKSILRYLRRGSASTSRAFKIFQDIEKEHKKHQLLLEAKMKKLKESCLSELVKLKSTYLDEYTVINENVTAFESSLNLLIPDPKSKDFLASMLDTPPGSPRRFGGGGLSPIIHESDEHLREHGVLVGTSSGAAMMSNMGGISLDLQCSADGVPKVALYINDENDSMVEALLEQAKILKRKNFNTLCEWNKLVEQCYSVLPETQWEPTIFSNIQALYQNATEQMNLFLNRIIIYDRCKKQLNIDFERSVCNNSCNSESEGEFEDVCSILTSPRPDSDDPTEPTSKLTKSLPWDPNSSGDNLDIDSDAKITNQTVFKVTKRKRIKKNDIGVKREKDISWQQAHVINAEAVAQNMKPCFRHENDSLHRFWRPIDPQEYEVPDINQVEDFITSSSVTNKPKVETGGSPGSSTIYDPSPLTPESPLHGTQAQSPSQLLRCWAPLLSGGLCQRQPSSGHCKFHGRVVKRHADTGCPLDPKEASRLQQEQVLRHENEKTIIKEKTKKINRRRHPNLVDINNDPRSQLFRKAKRIFKKSR